MTEPDEIREEAMPYGGLGLPSPTAPDPVLDAFKADVDRSLLRVNLALTPEQRSRKFQSFMESVYHMRGVANRGGKVWR